MSVRLLFILAISFLACGCVLRYPGTGISGATTSTESDFDACVRKGGKVTRTFPPRCFDLEGVPHEKAPEQRFINGRMCTDRCGDGACQQIVCAAAGCPWPEDPVSCASDCIATMD